MGIFLGIAVAEDDGEALSEMTAASSLKRYDTDVGGECQANGCGGGTVATKS
jgi:hypothetical protein